MEKTVKNIFKYAVPILMIIILLIPFICIDGSGLKHIHLSPLTILYL